MSYKIQFAATDGGTTYVNRGPTDSDGATIHRVVSSITVMEIAA